MKLGVTSHGQLRLVVLDEGVSTSQVRINWEGNYQEIVLLGKDGNSNITHLQTG